jgi:hypothetical protein
VESDLTEVLVKDGILNGLVGWWKFDEASGTVAYDSSGNGNDGNLTNGPTWTDGKIGGALSFDGVNDFVVLDNFELGGEMSFSVWVRYFALNKWSRVFDFGIENNHHQIFLANRETSAEPHFSYKASTSSYSKVEGLNLINLNDWAHYAITYSESGIIKLFRSSNLISTNLNAVTPQIMIRNYHYLGKSLAPGDGFLNAVIDDLRIYDRALSAEEVQALYNLGQ